MSPGLQLVVCLYRMSRGNYLYTKGRSTVGGKVDEVMEASIKNLWKEHVTVHFPGNDE